MKTNPKSNYKQSNRSNIRTRKNNRGGGRRTKIQRGGLLCESSTLRCFREKTGGEQFLQDIKWVGPTGKPINKYLDNELDDKVSAIKFPTGTIFMVTPPEGQKERRTSITPIEEDNITTLQNFIEIKEASFETLPEQTIKDMRNSNDPVIKNFLDENPQVVVRLRQWQNKATKSIQGLEKLHTESNTDQEELTPIDSDVLKNIEQKAEEGIFLVNKVLDEPERFDFAVSCFRNFKQYGCPYTELKFDANSKDLLINKIASYSDCFDSVETLDLSQTTITKLPMNFSKMMSLKYVYLPETITSRRFYDFAVKVPTLRVIDVPGFYKREKSIIRHTRISNHSSVTTLKIGGINSTVSIVDEEEAEAAAKAEAEAAAKAEAEAAAEAERLAAESSEAAEAAEAAKAKNLKKVGKKSYFRPKEILGMQIRGKLYSDRIEEMEKLLNEDNLTKFFEKVERFKEKYPHFGEDLMKDTFKYKIDKIDEKELKKFFAEGEEHLKEIEYSGLKNILQKHKEQFEDLVTYLVVEPATQQQEATENFEIKLDSNILTNENHPLIVELNLQKNLNKLKKKNGFTREIKKNILIKEIEKKLKFYSKQELFKVISNFKLQVQMAQFEQEMKSEEQGGQTNTELITYDGIPSMLFELREPVEDEKDDKVKDIIKTIFKDGQNVLDQLMKREAQRKARKAQKNPPSEVNTSFETITSELKEDYKHLLLFPNCVEPSLIINLSGTPLKIDSGHSESNA